ncbi:MAG: hypothetical protein ABIY55_23905 [Kofleriaceae bacterium]
MRNAARRPHRLRADRVDLCSVGRQLDAAPLGLALTHSAIRLVGLTRTKYRQGSTSDAAHGQSRYVPLMLHDFLHANRVELMARCRAKVATRSSPSPTPSELNDGIPVLLDQLVAMLRAELVARPSQAEAPTTDIDLSATKHGADLLLKGFTVDQVVHD